MEKFIERKKHILPWEQPDEEGTENVSSSSTEAAVPNPKAAVTYHFFFLCIRKPQNCLIIEFYRNLRVLGKHKGIAASSRCMFVTASYCNFVQIFWEMPLLINWNKREHESISSFPEDLTAFILKLKSLPLTDWIGYQSVSVSNCAFSTVVAPPIVEV